LSAVGVIGTGCYLVNRTDIRALAIKGGMVIDSFSFSCLEENKPDFA
jgi:hypothetical protein